MSADGNSESPKPSTAPRIQPQRSLRSRTVFDSLLHFASAEFLLKERPTGGGVVFARATWTALFTYACAVALKESLPPSSKMEFSAAQLRLAVADTLPWLGAIFAGTYAAFYTRFQSQYAYLASLYNQIMATQVQCPSTEANKETYAAWWAGFIEDAEELHLDTKPVFASVINSIKDRPGVHDKYVEHTPGGEARWTYVVGRVTRVLAAEAERQRKRIAG